MPFGAFIGALSKDKKNVGVGSVTLILPNKESRVFRDQYPLDDKLKGACEEFFAGLQA